MNTRIAWGFVVVVGAGWFLAEIVFPAIIKGYTPPAGISAAVGSISGVVIALMAAQATQKKNGNGKPSKSEAGKAEVESSKAVAEEQEQAEQRRLREEGSGG